MGKFIEQMLEDERDQFCIECYRIDEGGYEVCDSRISDRCDDMPAAKIVSHKYINDTRYHRIEITRRSRGGLHRHTLRKLVPLRDSK